MFFGSLASNQMIKTVNAVALTSKPAPDVDKTIEKILWLVAVRPVRSGPGQLLTSYLSDWHRGSQGTRLTAPTRVDSHHANMQQVTSCQVLDAVAVGRGQLLVGNHPV